MVCALKKHRVSWPHNSLQINIKFLYSALPTRCCGSAYKLSAVLDRNYNDII